MLDISFKLRTILRGLFLSDFTEKAKEESSG